MSKKNFSTKKNPKNKGSKEIEELKDEIEKLKDQLQRTQADFINYKKRNEKEKIEFVSFANAELILAILPVLDNLKRAQNNLPKEIKDNQWCQGILEIEKQFGEILKKIGLKTIETKNIKYNPELHEALMQGDGGKREEILEVFEEGYMLNDKIIRPAKVKVGKD